METYDGFRMHGYSILVTIAFYARAIVSTFIGTKDLLL